MSDQDWQPEDVNFTLYESGRITVARWPRQIEVERRVFATAEPERFKQDGSSITVVVANGHAVYQVVEHDHLRDCLLAVLESSRLSAP